VRKLIARSDYKTTVAICESCIRVAVETIIEEDEKDKKLANP
jgi:hypothetical protein